MKINGLLIVLALTFCSSLFAQKKDQYQFPLDENLKFKISFGWLGISLGEAVVSIGDSVRIDKGNSYYNTTVVARTVGLFSWLAGIEDTFNGHVNTQSYKTSYSEKKMRQRKENFDQWNAFDWDNMKVYARSVDYLNEGKRESWTVDLTKNTYDVLGTYLFLRSRNWQGYEKGDSILIKTFFEKKLYDFGMEYAGEETIKFEGNRVKTSKFYILFPVSSTFPKEKAVTVWVTKRNNMNIPLRIEADMKIGKVTCELASYSVKGYDPTNLFKD